jgi:hypothetical protein
VFNILRPLLLVVFFSNCFAQDPMRPPSWLVSNQPDHIVTQEVLNLQQILSSKNRKLAIINDTLVVKGQIIGGAKVTEITDQWVKVSYKGHTTTLTMTATTKEYIREE